MKHTDAAAVERRRVILADFGAVMEAGVSPIEIQDVEHLPHSKEAILQAILDEVESGDGTIPLEALGFAAATLPHFQPGIGAQPLPLYGVAEAALDSFKGTRARPVEEIRTLLSNMVATTKSETRDVAGARSRFEAEHEHALTLVAESLARRRRPDVSSGD